MINVRMSPSTLPVDRYSDVTIYLVNSTKNVMFSSIVLDIEAHPPMRLSGRRSIRLTRLPPDTTFNHTFKVFLPAPGEYVLCSNNFSFRDDVGQTHRFNLRLPVAGESTKEKVIPKKIKYARKNEKKKQPLDVFISYAHADEEYANKLKKHLATLRRGGQINDWYDGCILPGGIWQSEIDKALKRADIILLLVSSDFLDSYFCIEKELSVALRLKRAGKTRIIPVILRDCRWREESFGSFKALPRRGALPITLFKNEDTGFREVVDGIADVVKSH